MPESHELAHLVGVCFFFVCFFFCSSSWLKRRSLIPLEPPRDKTNKMVCAPSLIGVFAVRSMGC